MKGSEAVCRVLSPVSGSPAGKGWVLAFAFFGPPPRPQDRKTVARTAQPEGGGGARATTDRISQNLQYDGGGEAWAAPRPAQQ